ncbi:MAG: hypothetical protein N2C12_14685, partial [Planctomycetales bacterium]
MKLKSADNATLAEVVQKSEYSAPTPGDMNTAVEQLAQTTATLTAFLDGSRQNGAGWNKYLRWAKLQAAVAAGDSFDASDLESVERRFAADQPGLEMAQFADVRRAIQSCLRLRSDLGDAKMKAQFELHIGKLATQLKSKTARESSDGRYEIGSNLGWFHDHGQLDWLTKTVRSKLSHPNLMVSISNQFIDQGA